MGPPDAGVRSRPNPLKLPHPAPQRTGSKALGALYTKDAELRTNPGPG
jgi:hypothetical protein